LVAEDTTPWLIAPVRANANPARRALNIRRIAGRKPPGGCYNSGILGRKFVPDLASSVSSTLTSYYEEVRGKVHEWTAPLSDDQLWRKPYPYGNSVGHILLHLTGNLNYYIGARVAGTGYVRDRDREFNDTVKRSKQEILADFDRAISMVAATIRKQSSEDWTAAYSAEREPHSKDRFSAFFRCAAHAYHHVGQIIYLVKELNKTPV
jgi:uncharacterized damage-inducible protein DinB